jgi:CP family cyanate transporter-like MFS transporter
VKTPAGALAALFLAALTLRPQVVGVAPLISDIQDDLHTSHAVAGLLGTIPVLCMGLFAPVGAYLAGRVGTNVALAAALAFIGVFGVVRALVPGAWLVILLTFPVGVGMGLGTALAPLAVRERVPDRPATGTGVYTTGIQIGSASSAALAVPLAAALGGWRWALVTFSLVALAIFVAWVVLVRPKLQPAERRFRRPRLPLRSPQAWMLVAIFALLGMAYYGLNAWLPDAYTEQHGWSERSAGLLLAMMNLTAIPASFLVAWLSERHGGRRPFLIAMSVVFTVGALGLVTLPGIAYGCSLLAGVSQGGMFALVMTLPLDYERGAERVAALVAMMLGLGYTISATGPFILGAVRDVTGSFDGPLWLAVGLLAAIVPLVIALPRPQVRGAALAEGGAAG